VDDRVTRNLLMLPRLLRRAGVQVSAQRARSYLQAIAEIGLDHADDVRDASRASLVSRQTDLAPFDVTFDLFWSLLRGASLPTVVPGPRSPDAKADQIEVPLGQVPARMTPLVQRAVRVVASPVELLREIDFSAMTTAERAAATRFLERLRWSPGERPSRRFRAGRYGPRFDSRATLRRMLSTRGEPVVPNGLALCKLHHAAFDGHLLGINPDLVVHVARAILHAPATSHVARPGARLGSRRDIHLRNAAHAHHAAAARAPPGRRARARLAHSGRLVGWNAHRRCAP